jgi:hypothetical protein
LISHQQKRQRLASLTQEVQQLHPFIHAWAKALPNIREARYTHGTKEFGADFVLTKDDQTTGRVRFVGVIVKAGSITQGKTQELDRQLEECQIMPRLAEHGMKDIHIGEVWVVASEGISNNVRDKVKEKYRGLSIEFFDGDDVVALADKHGQFLWQSVPSRLGHYLVGLDKRLETDQSNANLLGSGVPVPNIELDLSPIAVDDFRGKGRSKKKELVSLRDEIAQRKVIVVEGEMGSGKSHLLRQVGRQYCSLDGFEDHKLVPVYLAYRDLLAKYRGSLRECIDGELAEILPDIQESGATVLLLIDGIDEVKYDDEEEQESAENLVEDAIQLDGAKVVISTRPRSQVRAKRASALVRRLSIRPLTLGKIVTFIREVCAAQKMPARVVDDVNRSELFQQLPQNPIAAQLLTRLLLEKRDELPRSLTELYSKSMELMLGRWDEQKGLADQQEYEVSKRVFSQVANKVLTNRLPAISANEISQHVREYIAERNLEVDAARIEARMFERSGLLLIDPETGAATFRHRSFAEFLFADYRSSYDELGSDAHPFSFYWHTSYFFWLGIKGDCEYILRKIISTPCADTNERLGRLFCIPQYLMAAHLTPYVVTKETVSKLLLETAELYELGLAGKAGEWISKLSPMQYLWLLTYVVRNRYGYRYFLPALQDACLEIGQQLDSPKTRSTAMFFAAVTGLDMDDEAPLELLLENYKLSDFQMPVALALQAETEELPSKRKSARVREFGKRLRQLFSEEVKGSKGIEGLYRQAIGAPSASSVIAKGKKH